MLYFVHGCIENIERTVNNIILEMCLTSLQQ